MDLVGIGRDMSAAVCRNLAKKYGFAREAIILSSSHTHTGPVVSGNLKSMYTLDPVQQKYVDDYSQGLEEKLVRVAGEALARLAPVELTWSIGRTTFAVNRRNNKE